GGSILGRWWRYKWITFHPSLTIIVSLATVAVPAGQSLLMPDSSITTPSSTTITTTPVERPVTLDGMAVDAIPQVHPVTQDHAVTKAVV
ncbi:hypothetical protein, partial [Escherichia coli]|uniref:hypothetical protein n=1 Tax=Escherichia coli TaxID=562 RepID=UPI001BB471B9